MTNFSLLQWQLSTPQKLKLDKTLFSALDAQLHSSPRQILLRFTKWLEILPVLPQSMPIVLTTIEIVRSPFSTTCEHQNPSWKQPPYTEFSTPNCSSNRKKKLQILSETAFQWQLWKQLKKKVPSLCIKHTENFTTPNFFLNSQKVSEFPTLASQCHYSLL